VTQVQVTVTGVVGLQVGRNAGPVEPSVVAVEQSAADATVLLVRVHGEERQVVVRVERVMRVERGVQFAGALEGLAGHHHEPPLVVLRRRDQ
jgi:hypothetical protein